MALTQATSAEAFLQTLGVNTHIDSLGYGYGDLSNVADAINYLGLSNLRDSPQSPIDLTLWQQVAQATGATFDAYIGWTSPDGMSTDLGHMPELAQQGILNSIEGGNEEDDSYAASLGNNLQITAAFQQQLYATAQSLGLPAINMSFGSGWTPADGWHGNYDSVGDLSGVADYANAHVYPAAAPDITIGQLNDDAHLAAASLPVAITELGYDTAATDPVQTAKWTLDAALDGMKDGDVKTYFYALFDDQSGAYGLMNSDGSPKPAGQALHNLTTLLDDNGSVTPGALDYSIDAANAGDNSLLLAKSDGTFWLALWNEADADHTVTLNLGSAANQIDLFDPLDGTGAVQSFGNTNSAQITIPDHPVLVEIAPSGLPASTASASSATPQVATAGRTQIAADETASVITDSGAAITASAGDHMIFLAGTSDTLTATGGNEDIQAYLGGSNVTTGAGDDTIRIAGSGSTIDAGSGYNHLEDSGSGNTIVLPGADQGYDDIFGWVAQNGDSFDLRPALATTGWNGDASSLGNFVQASSSGNDTIVTVDPDGTSGASGSAVATLHEAGWSDLSSLLAHAIT